MFQNVKWVKVHTLLTQVVLTMYLFIETIRKTVLSEYTFGFGRVSIIVMFIFLLLNLLARKYARSQIIFGLIALTVGGLVWYFSKESRMLAYIGLVLCMYDVSERLIYKHFLWIVGGITLLLAFLSTAGLVEMVTSERIREGKEYIRYSFGYGYPTEFAATCFYLFAVTLAHYRNLSKRIILILGSVLSIGILWLTDSRFNSILIMLLMVLVLISKIKSFPDWLKKLFVWASPVLMCVTIILSLLYNSKNLIWRGVNSFFSDRLSLSWNAFHNFKITFFGQELSLIGYGRDPRNIQGTYNYIDSSYLQLLFIFGVVTMILFVGAHVFLSYRAYLNNDNILLSILFTVATAGVIESTMIYISQNVFSLLIFALLYKDTNSSKLFRSNVPRRVKRRY